jgi:type II secretory pathway component GspD/PulD (secretin)
VKDGGTVIIAGLLHNRSRKSISGVPGLSSIPLFGAFFRKDETTDLDRQIAVFITPRILDTDLQAADLPREATRQAAHLAGKEFDEQLKASLLKGEGD